MVSSDDDRQKHRTSSRNRSCWRFTTFCNLTSGSGCGTRMPSAGSSVVTLNMLKFQDGAHRSRKIGGSGRAYMSQCKLIDGAPV